MRGRALLGALCWWLVTQTAATMIMRNNELMTKMVSKFHGGGNPRGARSDPEHTRITKVLNIMQDVLCNNFQNIPCDVIKRDYALKNLIEQSILLIKNKEANLESQTSPPAAINNEDLSNFLQINNINPFRQKKKIDKKSKKGKVKNVWSHERQSHPEQKGLHGRKKGRKFYPHKKLKDSEEIKSMSEEAPATEPSKKRRRFSYKREPVEPPPVWQIDYVKGEPELNIFNMGRTDTLKTKLIKQVPNLLMADDVVEQGDKAGILHSDVYIKKNISNRRHSGRQLRMD